MKPCHNCQTVIDEYLFDKQLEPLRELTVDDFNVCVDCRYFPNEPSERCLNDTKQSLSV